MSQLDSLVLPRHVQLHTQLAQVSNLANDYLCSSIQHFWRSKPFALCSQTHMAKEGCLLWGIERREGEKNPSEGKRRTNKYAGICKCYLKRVIFS